MASLRDIILVSAAALALLAGCGSDSDSISPTEQATNERAALGKGTGTALKAAGSCEALEQELKTLAAAEIETWFSYRDDPVVDETAVDTANDSAGDEAGAESAPEFTNNQVAGVDEADFAKTDGERLYVIGNGDLHRFDISDSGTISAARTAGIEGRPREMLIDGNRVLVFSAVYAHQVEQASADNSLSFVLPSLVKVTLLDWPDDGQPVVVEERYHDGGYHTARNIDGVAHAVIFGALPNPVLDSIWEYTDAHDDDEAARSAALADLAALELAELLPQSYRREADGSLVAQPYTENDCAAFHVPEDSNSGGVTSILTLAMHGDAAPAPRHIVSNRATVYVSADYLVLAENAQDWWWYAWDGNTSEKLNLHAFELAATDVRYVGSARAEGTPINSFALDERDDVLRIATTTGRGFQLPGRPESHLFTFAIEPNALRPLGRLDGIAPGEVMFAARFADDVAWLVTFEQIDPLFTVDLSNASDPAIVGELKVPGFSTYLHPVPGDRLLAVGVGGDDDGATWNTVVSLFDVSDLANPQLLTGFDFAHDNNGWNWSEALHEHKAFQFHAQSGLLAIPFGAYRETNGVYEWINTLELVRLDGNTLASHGSIDHSAYHDSHGDNLNSWSRPQIRRSFFIGDFIYAIGDLAVTAHPRDNPAVVTADALIPPQAE